MNEYDGNDHPQDVHAQQPRHPREEYQKEETEENKGQPQRHQRPQTQNAPQKRDQQKPGKLKSEKQEPAKESWLKAHRALIITVVLAVAITAGIAYALYRWHEGEKEKAELVAHGNVDIRQVELGFRVAGRITQMKFEEGDAVKKGDVVAVLDKTTFAEDVSSLKASKLQAKAAIAERMAVYENAQLFARRQKNLVASGSIAKQEYDNAVAQVKQADAQLGSARAALEAAEARANASETNLADTEILAPNDGVIFTRAREPGAIVPAGASVYTLSLSHPIWIRAYVAESDLGRIKTGMQADVKTDTEGNPILHGQIGFISPQAEFTPKNIETKELRTDLVYRIRVLVDDDQGILRQGMPVTVTIPTDKRTYREERRGE